MRVGRIEINAKNSLLSFMLPFVFSKVGKP